MNAIRPQQYTNVRARFWRRLADAQLLATVVVAVYVYAVNGVMTTPAPVAVRIAAIAFRTCWSYVYVRYLLARSINRVTLRCPRSRAGRLTLSLAEGLWAQGVDLLFFALIGAERVASVLPFIATNTASVFLSSEASLAGHPPERWLSPLGLLIRQVSRTAADTHEPNRGSQ